MTEIIPIKERVLKRDLTLEEYIDILCKYGNPKLYCMRPGEWHCSLDMFVQGQGVEFKIASEFKETSMLNAARVCYERLERALADLGLPLSGGGK